MSSTIRLLSAIAVFLSSVSATFYSPQQGATWQVSAPHQIQWDTAGLSEPLQLHLAPGGSTDVDSYISTLAPTIPNTGSWTWQPSTSIPQHSSYIIIIIDSGGYYQKSPPFQMIGWPQHTTVISAPMHTVAPPVYVPPPAHVSPPVYVAPPADSAPLQPSAVIVTSLLVQPVIHTSQPPPIIKTIEKPPIIQTEQVAPIVLTQSQQPVTKIQTQPNLVTTEYQQPIVKTILVTETPAPIVKYISQEPITIIESQAPILITESQAPIIKTISQPPHILTEHVAPVIMTSEFTQTIHFTSLIHVSQPPMHTPVVVYTPPMQHTTFATIETPAVPMVIHTGNSNPVQSDAPLYPNTTSTSIEIPTFTTPLALGATNPGAASSSGLSGLQPTFISAASSRSVSAGLLSAMVAFIVVLV